MGPHAQTLDWVAHSIVINFEQTSTNPFVILLALGQGKDEWPLY
jgi:hypothetical protein